VNHNQRAGADRTVRWNPDTVLLGAEQVAAAAQLLHRAEMTPACHSKAGWVDDASQAAWGRGRRAGSPPSPKRLLGIGQFFQVGRRAAGVHRPVLRRTRGSAGTVTEVVEGCGGARRRKRRVFDVHRIGRRMSANG
jgi:hypothetical protein